MKPVIVASLILLGVIVGAGVSQLSVLPMISDDNLRRPIIRAVGPNGEVVDITLAQAFSQVDLNNRLYLTDLAKLMVERCGGNASSTNETQP